jgi:hypothetical protein
MKKSELKNIIKECVKEVIFEEGVLSGIITEVVQGIQGGSIIRENAMTKKAFGEPTTQSAHLQETKKQVLSAIAKDSYDDIKKKFSNPSLFEGTQPAPASDGSGPLAGVASNDPGVDISNIPGLSSWSHMAKGNSK